jgi:hypothetical protein
MLEILVLFFLGRDIGNTAESKGRTKLGYIVMMIALWFTGEGLGAMAGAVAAPNTLVYADFHLGIYLCALAGAALGGVTAYLIVKSLPDLSPGAHRRAHAADVIGEPVVPAPPIPTPPPPAAATLPPRPRRPQS